MFIAGCKKDLHVTVNAKWRRRVGFRIGKYLLSLKSSEPESLTGILLKNGKKIPHPNQPTNQPNSQILKGGKKREVSRKCSKHQIFPSHSDFVALVWHYFDPDLCCGIYLYENTTNKTSGGKNIFSVCLGRHLLGFLDSSWTTVCLKISGSV